MNTNYLENTDCITQLQKLPNESINLIIADPPYFQIFGEFDFGIWKNYKEYLSWCREWLMESQRVLKNDGTIMIWGALGKKEITFARLAIMIEDEAIFHRQNWITQRNTRGIGAKTNYMSTREDLLFLTKSENYYFHIPYSTEKSERKDLGKNGKPRKNQFKRISNVWFDITEASQSSIERCEHPTVKAQKLCDRIIQTHSKENDLIYIPFLGSGSEIISCIKNNRNFIGAELNSIYFDLAKKRIKQFTNYDI